MAEQIKCHSHPVSRSQRHFSIRGIVSIVGISPYPHPIAITLRSALLFKMSSLRAVSVRAPALDQTAPEPNVAKTY